MDTRVIRIAIAALVVLPLSCALRAAHGGESIEMPASALSVPPPAASAPLDPVDAKVHAQLRNVLEHRARGAAIGDEVPAALRSGEQVLVQVDFDGSVTRDDARGILTRHGAVVRHSLSPALHEAWLPLDRVSELAQETSVVSVAPARLIQRLATSGEGLVASNTKYWQTFNPSYTGTGLTIAMIDSFDKTGIAALQSSGDWPASTGGSPPLSCFDLKNTSTAPPYAASSCTAGTFGSGGIRHGNATLELAYDMAPGAKYRAYDTIVVGDWYDAILDAANVSASGTALGAIRANVISASLSAPNDSIGDGTAIAGSIAEAAGFARARGILVVNAAGNERQNHWGGTFTAASSGGGYHTWSGANTIYNYFGSGNSAACVAPNTLITASMYWNNWVPSGSTFAANHDYDLYVYENFGSAGTPNWMYVAASNNLQNGGSGQKPIEYVQYTTSNAGTTAGCSSGSAVYAIVVVRAITTAATDNLQVFGTAQNSGGSYQLNYSVPERSLDFPADSPNVLSVAAIDVVNNTQEAFSSEGPVLASGGAIPFSPAPGSDPNLKPDLASFDDVTTATLSGKFFGTSAAAPQVAGMGALFMQRFGVQASAANLDAKIVNPLRAIAATGSNDLGAVGKDYQYGNGRLRFQKETMIKFITQPSSALANTAITPAIKAGLYDAENKAVPYTLFDTVALAIANDPNGGAAVLSGGGNASLIAGVGTYAAAKIDLGGSGYTLKASATAAATPPINLSVTSSAFNITTGAASKLVFTVQPSSVQAGKPVTPAIKVSVEDSAGNVVNSNNTAVVTLTRTSCAGALSAGTQTASSGVATFNSIALYATGTTTLTATASGLSSAVSSSFTVSANPDYVFRGSFESCNP